MAKKEILRVRGNIKEIYSKLSKTYAFIEEKFEKDIRSRGLTLLSIKQGEVILEIGFGTGSTLVEMAKAVGDSGKVYGIDLTPKMVELATNRLYGQKLANKVDLREGDAREMPYKNQMFDAVYLASTLELFDTPDIPKVLLEIKRVLKPTGRICVVSIPKEKHENSIILRMYEWFHKTFPKYASCRPIYVEDSIKDGGYDIIKTEELMMDGIFPMKIVVAKPT
jgi:demethylmenaquinone methyltransferase/2-methoxy-6-polyprenyl-1,4-benzoquinol methylase